MIKVAKLSEKLKKSLLYALGFETAFELTTNPLANAVSLHTPLIPKPFPLWDPRFDPSNPSTQPKLTYPKNPEVSSPTERMM